MGMHFKLGLYEHQSAGAISGLLHLIKNEHKIIGADNTNIDKIKITAYEPAYGIIGDPAKMNPTTRQSADHSMAFIIASILKNSLEQRSFLSTTDRIEDYWKQCMLTPQDYSRASLFDETTRDLMSKIEFIHGGEEYDSKYPEGIPSSI